MEEIEKMDIESEKKAKGKLFNMRLMQTIIIDNHEFTRVPCGWVYKFGGNNSTPHTFIPFGDEAKEGRRDAVIGELVKDATVD